MSKPDRPFVGWTFQMTQAQLDLKLAEARADALREAAERVRGLDTRSVDDDGDGYGGVEFVHLGSVLALLSEIGTTNGK